MRRTTISRSDLTVAAVLLVAAVPRLAAQVSVPNIQRPIQAAQGAANATNQNTQRQQAPAEDQSGAPRRAVTLGTPQDATAAPQGTTPSTHTVVQGETLWGLAQQYLGDPLLWPELYRLNTNVVEDPHWIYPGEELRLTAPPTTVAASSDSNVVVQSQNVTMMPVDTQHVAPPPAPVSTGPTIFSQRNQVRSRSSMNLEVQANRAYRAVREGEYFSSGFMTEGQTLNSGRIVRTSAEERDMTRTRTDAFLYETIVISPPDGETFQNGDKLLSFRREEDMSGYGDVIIPTGLVTVTGTTGTANLLTARATSMFQPMVAGQELIRVQPFVYNQSARAVPVTNGVEGRVIRLREARSVPQIQDVLFIDKGANDGIQLGDVFQVYIVRADPDHGGTVEQDQGRAIVVNTRPQTSTIVLVELYRGDVGSQSQVRQIRRMPS